MLEDIWRKPAICLLESAWRMISRMLRRMPSQNMITTSVPTPDMCPHLPQTFGSEKNIPGIKVWFPRDVTLIFN